MRCFRLRFEQSCACTSWCIPPKVWSRANHQDRWSSENSLSVNKTPSITSIQAKQRTEPGSSIKKFSGRQTHFLDDFRLIIVYLIRWCKSWKYWPCFNLFNKQKYWYEWIVWPFKVQRKNIVLQIVIHANCSVRCEIVFRLNFSLFK